MNPSYSLWPFLNYITSILCCIPRNRLLNTFYLHISKTIGNSKCWIKFTNLNYSLTNLALKNSVQSNTFFSAEINRSHTIEWFYKVEVLWVLVCKATLNYLGILIQRILKAIKPTCTYSQVFGVFIHVEL